MKEAIICLMLVFSAGCVAGALGQYNYEIQIVNKAICKQLYKDTNTYLKQIEKPWIENVSKISECEVGDGTRPR